MHSEIAVMDAAKPVVTIQNSTVRTNSRDVARYFRKEHRDVLRAIDTLIKQEPELGLRNFAQTSVKVAMPNGGQRDDRQFGMDRRGFTVLAMGFTGKAALAFKLAYIDAFEAMEAELNRPREPAPPVLDPNDPSQLRALLIDYSERTLALQARVSELEPQGRALERIAVAKGSLCITDAAKALQMRPSDLFAYLRAHRWIFKRFGSSHDRAFEDKRQAGLLEHKLSAPDPRGWTFDQVRVTPKGMAALSSVFSQPLLLEQKAR